MRFSKREHTVTLSVVSAIILVFYSANRVGAATITVNSGTSVTFLDSGSSNTDFSAPFTAANFTAAQSGSAAFLTTNGAYFPATNIPGAAWIGTNATAATNSGDTALYAISFVLPSAVSSASLTFQYGVDNALGDTNAGIYINGTALPNSTDIPCGVGNSCATSFQSVQTYTDTSIGSLLNSGTNWLYIDGVNLGGPGALIFSANVTYTPGTVTGAPEPSALFLMVLGVAAIAIWRIRSTRPSMDGHDG